MGNIVSIHKTWFNIKKSSYQYRKSHCGDKTILRPSYLHNGISYTGKISSLYWIRAQIPRQLIQGELAKCSETRRHLALITENLCGELAKCSETRRHLALITENLCGELAKCSETRRHLALITENLCGELAKCSETRRHLALITENLCGELAKCSETRRHLALITENLCGELAKCSETRRHLALITENLGANYIFSRNSMNISMRPTQSLNLQKRFRHSRRMRNPQFYLSGKRPMG